jgi:hypothetical protein
MAAVTVLSTVVSTLAVLNCTATAEEVTVTVSCTLPVFMGASTVRSVRVSSTTCSSRNVLNPGAVTVSV